MRRLSLMVMILWSLLGCEATVNRNQLPTRVGTPPPTSQPTTVKRSQPAVPQGAPVDHLQRGQAAYDQKDYTTALNEWGPLARQGQAEAQNRLGILYARGGAGVDKNEAQAVHLFRQAATQGHAQAQFNLGLAHERGLGVPRDLTEAQRWFTQAAETAAPGSDRETMLQARDRVARQLAASPSPTPSQAQAPTTSPPPALPPAKKSELRESSSTGASPPGKNSRVASAQPQARGETPTKLSAKQKQALEVARRAIQEASNAPELVGMRTQLANLQQRRDVFLALAYQYERGEDVGMPRGGGFFGGFGGGFSGGRLGGLAQGSRQAGNAAGALTARETAKEIDTAITQLRQQYNRRHLEIARTKLPADQHRIVKDGFPAFLDPAVDDAEVQKLLVD